MTSTSSSSPLSTHPSQRVADEPPWCGSSAISDTLTLNGDVSAADTTPVRQAARTPSSPVGSGVAAWGLPHTSAWWSSRASSSPTCWRNMTSINLVEFLQIYSTSILTAGGNEVVMTNYFPMALIGTT
jgi:hypothetical protein